MRNLYARFVLWLIRPALELRKEQADDRITISFPDFITRGTV